MRSVLVEIMVNPETLEIVKYPAQVLRKVCQPVEDFDDSLRGVCERMFELMKASNGVGLAAPQVGLLRRLFVCNPTGEPDDEILLINPELVDLEGSAEGDEGCLSIPEVLVTVRRAERCTIRAQDLSGRAFERPGEGLVARVWQHENDHLDGKLILDYMDETSRLTNRRALRFLEDSCKRQ